MILYDIKIIFQVASTILIILILALEIKQIMLHQKNIGYMIAIIFWMIHALIFYIFVFLNQLGIFNISVYIPTNTWSSGLRFHAYVTIASIEISRLRLINFKKKALSED